jgi:hypothetical protein
MSEALLNDIRAEIRALRGDFSQLQDRLLRIGFGLAGVQITAIVALIIALA